MAASCFPERQFCPSELAITGMYSAHFALFLCFAIFFKKLNEHFSSFVHHELPLASRFFSQDGSLFSRSKEIPVGCPTPPGNDLASRRGGKKFAKGTSKAETLEHHRTIPLKAGNYSVLYGNRTATLA
jgi:hypothetical protein